MEALLSVTWCFDPYKHSELSLCTSIRLVFLDMVGIEIGLKKSHVKSHLMVKSIMMENIHSLTGIAVYTVMQVDPLFFYFIHRIRHENTGNLYSAQTCIISSTSRFISGQTGPLATLKLYYRFASHCLHYLLSIRNFMSRCCDDAGTVLV